MSEAPNPLSQYFATNSSPNPIELATIRKEIDQYDIAIGKIRLELRNLEAGRQRYEGLLSPLRRKPLPLEILGEVFSYLIYPLFSELDELHEFVGMVGYDVGSGRNALINLCLVCKAWRDAVYATPPLWSRVDIYWDSLDFEKVNQWLNRSRGVPKSLVIYPHDLSQELTDDHLTILEELLTAGPPLGRLDLRMSNGPEEDEAHLQRLADLLKPVLDVKFPPPPWNSLKSFTLQFSGSNAEISDVVIPRFPHLKSLHLRLPSFYDEDPWDDDHQSVPFDIPQDILEGLTNLTLSNCDWTGCTILALIRWCKNVKTLTVRHPSGWLINLDSPFLQGLTSTGIPLPAVQSLRLGNLCREQSDILRFLRTPSLVELDLSFDLLNADGNFEYPEEAEYQYPNLESLKSNILSLVKNPTSIDCDVDLRRLRLHNLYISANSLASILTSLPSLSHLTLDEVWFDSTLFKQLEAAGTKCLPRLEVLELLNVPECFHIPDVYAFVASRRSFGQPGITGMEGTAGLRELTMTVTPPPKDSGSGLRNAERVLREQYNLTANLGYMHSK
ncbi:hypothetical protein EST38_g6067 [Candolleomyces aberdarensis]|uniref:F-box domain-containing protein n=1 Tax=Candolleomyces aberdarensis TaxID=2316362 RepID=A0A4Q2DKM8_9AGAR|nr:hypothetical protein EST38_g6067 [Candolleomyces aberdarensis]